MEQTDTDLRTDEEQQGPWGCRSKRVSRFGSLPHFHTSTLPHRPTRSRCLRRFGVCALLALGAVAAAQEKPAPDGVLKHLGQLVGGEWTTLAKLTDGRPVARFIHTSECDGKLLRSRGRVANAPVETLIGWDPVAGKTFFLDRQGSDTVYFGHIRLEGEELHFEFRSLVGEPAQWRSREKFTSRDTYQTVTTPSGGQEGKDSQKLTLLRAPLTEQPPSKEVAEVEKLQTNLSRLSLMIGGVWRSEGKDPSGKPFAELRYAWGPGRKTLLGTGTLGGTRVESVIGWDPVAQKLYYLDRHGPDTLYFGHYTVHDEDITVDFRSLTGRPGQFRTNAWFPDANTYMAIVRPLKEGQVGEGHKVKLVRQKDEG